MNPIPLKKSLRLKISLIVILVALVTSVSVFFTTNLIFIPILALLLALFGVLTILLLLSPLEKLFHSMQSLSQGIISSQADIRTQDEIGQIASSFNTMAASLKQSFMKIDQERNVALAEKHQTEAILSSIVDGIIALDLSKRVAFVNRAAENLTGYSQKEVIGQSIETVIRLFDQKEEVTAKTYCPALNFSENNLYRPPHPLTLIGKGGKQALITLTSSHIAPPVQGNLTCVLVLHDVTHEKELEQMKLDFVAMASHELRTPLTSILGYISVFLQENQNKLTRDQKDLLDHVQVSAKHLLSLVENLLNVNKIERGRLQASIGPVNLPNLLTKAVQDLQTQAAQKNITLALSPPREALPMVLADPILIDEVINNLISNAINYTKEGGSVSVYTKVENGEVVTTVADTGIGIPPQAVPHLFTKFFRASGTLVPGSKGTGLGLYISKSIIDKHQGRIWVESEVGKGSRFSFSLLIAPSSTQPELKESVEAESRVITI